MSDHVEQYSLNELPDELLDDIGHIIKWYSTALIMETMSSSGLKYILIGSGTFVSISNTSGILTAAHVVEKLMKEKSVGRPYSLGLILRDYPHQYFIDSDYLEPMIIAKGQIDCEGPDLGFIVLPLSELGTIKAIKNFHNLDRNRERILTMPPKFSAGLWAICGVPDEKTIDAPEQNFDPHKRFLMLVGFGGIRGTYTVGEYDYCDMKVKHDSSPIIPDSFGGASGGGLWQIPLRKSSEETIEPIEYILSGVVFYETGREGLYQSVKCHGRNSIYDMSYSFITENRKPETDT